MRRRLFVAIDLPLKIKKKIAKEIGSLEAVYPQIRFENKDKYHITIRFLGNTTVKPPAVLENIKEKLIAFPSFEIGFGEIGIISNTNNVLVLEIISNEEILKLYYKLNNCLENLGFTREKRRFYPHLTLGRLKQTEINISSDIDLLFKKLPAVKVSEISLFSSQLTKDGSIYHKEGTISLAN